MKRTALALAGFALIAMAQQGENFWQGDLVDFQCKQQDQSQPCPVNAQTRLFALSADGGVLLRLDSKGNELAAKEIAGAGAAGTVAVTIETYEEGQVDDELQVKSVRITQPVTR